MAKPKHGRWNNHDRQRPSCCARALSRPFSRFPSPAVLSALAVIATYTPPVVAGSPLPLPTPPPTFLCPFIERDSIDPSSDIFNSLPPSTISTSSTPSPSPSPLPRVHHNNHQLIADRYVEGSDSLWRKTNQWTLYGSTCCSSSATAGTSGLQSQPSSTQTPMPTSTSTTATFDTSALPAGWDDATNSSSTTESTIILALAIVLAGSICVFMIGCLIWRKRKKKTRDIERKLRNQRIADQDCQDNIREKDVRGKMRMWARASARWKSNIRQSARRRRKKPMVDRTLSPSLCDSQVSVLAPSTPSRRGSFVAEEPDPSRPEPVSCLDGEPPDVQCDPPRSASPPTYGASLVPSRFPRLSPSSAVSHLSLTPPPDHPHSPQHSNRPPLIEDEPLPYVPRSDGHVATDDKAQLARIRELASSPPMIVDAASPSTTQSISAPEWHEVEDDMDNLGVDLGQVPMSLQTFGLPPSFPPLPSKADVPFGYLDDLPLRYGEGDDVSVPLSIPVPSGSSFGASPSAPPIDYPDLEPSAPSLESEDDLFQDWDGTSPCIPEASTEVDPDSAPASVTELPIPPTLSPISHASFPPTRESAARDSILPQYHP